VGISPIFLPNQITDPGIGRVETFLFPIINETDIVEIVSVVRLREGITEAGTYGKTL
jgi:hypothetical protein